MKNKEIYSHFIQKEIIKKWAVGDKIHYTIYNGKNDHQDFNVTEFVKNQVVVLKGSYSSKIKKSINALEVEGNKVINKITKQKETVSLTRKDLVTLKFYYIVNTIRINLLKGNTEDLDDDYLFRQIIKKTDKSPKEIQELKMELIIEKYNEFLKGDNPLFLLKERGEIINSLKRNKAEFPELIEKISKLFDLESSIKLQLNLLIKSKLAFVKFNDKGKLLLTEAGSFQEISKKPYLSAKYDFSVISPDMGILFIKESFAHEIIGFSEESSLIFTFDLKLQNNIKYVRELDIEKSQVRFLLATVQNMKDPKEMKKQNTEFDFLEKPKFYDEKDLFNYEVHLEEKAVADACNAMMLVQRNDSFVIYKNKSTYEDAIEMCKNKEQKAKK